MIFKTLLSVLQIENNYTYIVFFTHLISFFYIFLYLCVRDKISFFLITFYPISKYRKVHSGVFKVSFVALMMYH